MTLLIGSLLALLVLGLPIAFALGLSGAIGLWWSGFNLVGVTPGAPHVEQT